MKLPEEKIVEFFKTSGYFFAGHCVIDYLNKRASLLGSLFILNNKDHLLPRKKNKTEVIITKATEIAVQEFGNSLAFWYGVELASCQRHANEGFQEQINHVLPVIPKEHPIMGLLKDSEIEKGYTSGMEVVNRLVENNLASFYDRWKSLNNQQRGR